MLDEPGLGRKVTIAALLSHLSSSEDTTHLIICPVSALSLWSATLHKVSPSLSVTTYSGLASDRRRDRETILLGITQVVLVSYRTFFLDSDWFLSRTWSALVMAEIHNIVSAGSAQHIRSLVNLRSNHRVLMMTGQLRESPIDLWNTLYLLIPSVYFQRELSECEPEIEIEGTEKYLETKEKLATILKAFSKRRLRTIDNSQETRLCVELDQRKRKLYDDYLATTFPPQAVKYLSTVLIYSQLIFIVLGQASSKQDLRVVSSAIQRLQQICSEPSSSKEKSESDSLPSWCYVDKTQSKLWSDVDKYQPLENIHLDHLNLVFLSQEMTTTG